MPGIRFASMCKYNSRTARCSQSHCVSVWIDLPVVYVYMKRSEVTVQLQICGMVAVSGG